MKPIFLSLLVFTIFSCKAQEKQNDIVLQPEVVNYTYETLASDIAIPWGMTWLPDGSMLVTEKSGIIYHVKNKTKTEITNVPKVVARGQGGLLDIAVHPNYAQNGWIYITYSSNEGLEKGANTQLIRAKLEGTSLRQIQTVYKASPNTTLGHHFGSRIAFDNEGFVCFTVGDRGNHPENPQNVTRDGGKVYRLHDDGKIPADNPFVGQKGAKEAVFSFGHRNPQGMTKHPVSGKIWTHEHGPQGGDEINVVKKGANYGWPVITYGIDYDGTIISDQTQKEGMEQPLYYWVPSIAPSGMTFVTGDVYPNWNGHLLVGSLVFQYLELVKLDGEKVIGRQKIGTDIGRLRDVKQGPDGYIYMAVEGNGIIKIIPKG
ncbi:PQQ-dependent sugar dehydrogenase [Flavobacterium sp.]|jgi:glucose/arabinose dehydrogenase|uniref:PQQ-dependent sugar dehydrogenase n=1 Tax=Flavobacterium sp. TaxID=239 RepID=UPI0037C0F308